MVRYFGCICAGSGYGHLLTLSKISRYSLHIKVNSAFMFAGRNTNKSEGAQMSV